MDHDAPEPEELNLQESVTCAKVALIYLGRAADRAANALRRLGDLLRPINDDHMEPDDERDRADG